ncbi:hypothetical protein LCGC14_2700570, partial [marine sediment metagenome]
MEDETNAAIQIASGNTSYGVLFFSDTQDNTAGYIAYDHGTVLGIGSNAMTFQVNGGKRMTIDSSGLVKIGSVTGDANSATPAGIIYAEALNTHYKASLADDGFLTVNMKNRCIFSLTTNASAYFIGHNNFSGITTFNSSALTIDATNGTLNGTTGVDGAMTIRMNNGTLYVENRTGTGRNVAVTVIALSE